MDTIQFSRLIPKYDYDSGGDVFANYIKLYEDFINDIISSNEDIVTIFDARTCDNKYLPYLAALLGYEWNYKGNYDVQRYEILSFVERMKRAGTTWFLDNLFSKMGITYILRELVHHIITLSGPETLSGDFYMEGIQKFHEGSIEVIVNHSYIDGLYETLLASLPAGMHLHLTFST